MKQKLQKQPLLVLGTLMILFLISISPVKAGEESFLPPPPSLLIDASVSTTNPTNTEVFKYRIRYRCASITEHCYNSNITFELPPSLEIVSLPLAIGNVSSVTATPGGTGTVFDINLESPASAGAPAGALAAGSTGTLTIEVRFKCIDDAGMPGATINFVQSPVFSATDAGGTPTSSTAANPADVNVPAPLSTCIIPSPVLPPGWGKDNNSAVGAGQVGDYTITVPPHASSFIITDDFPENLKLRYVDTPVGWKIEVACGSGTYYEITSFGSFKTWVNSGTVGNPLNTDSGLSDCICNQHGPLGNGSFIKVVEDISGFRVTTPAGGSAATEYIEFGPIADVDTPEGTVYQNCVTTNNPAWVDDCAEMEITGKPIVRFTGAASPSPNLGSGQLSVSATAAGVNAYVDPLDIQLFYTVWEKRQSSKSLNGFYLDVLLPDGLDYIENGPTPNYWYVQWRAPGLGQAGCLNPTLSVTQDYQGSGRTYLRWDFPNCIFSGVLNEQAFSNLFRLFYSVRYDVSIPFPDSPRRFEVEGSMHSLDGSLLWDHETQQCVEEVSIVNNYNIPTSGGDMNSAKYVQGVLDTDFSRFPQTGNTQLSGEGIYEIFIRNNQFEDVKTLDVADILPFIGDKGLLSGGAGSRESAWSAQLASALTIERFKIGTGLLDASADLGANGVMYSSITDVCYLEFDGFVNQVKTNGTLGVDGTNTTCTAFAPGNPAAGAKAFAFQWNNAADPLTFGEYLKITVNINQLAGEADMTNGEIAWNSVAYTAIKADDAELLSSEPLKVGLKMIDPANFAAIGNFVWQDQNANGVQDGGEPVFSGVTVNLYNPDGTPVTETVDIGGVPTVIQVSTITNGNGYYCFNGLPPGTSYIVRLDNSSDFSGSGTLTPFTLTTANAGGDDALDSDAAMGNLAGMSADMYPEIAAMSPVAGQKDDSFDFGFYKPATIGNYVWYDDDGLGDQTGTENGVENVTVELLNSSGVVVDTKMTDMTGNYLFMNVSPGTYSVRFSTLPAGYVFTTQNGTGSNSNDSDVNSTGETSVFVVNSCDAITAIDAGIKMPPPNPASIAGTVWDDLDCVDGNRGANDEGVSGVTVQLLDNFGFVIQTSTTDANGDYIFENIPVGMTYDVTIVPPNLVTTFTGVGANMFFDPLTGTTLASITPVADENITGIDAGLCLPLSLGNLVWLDANNNGLFDGGEGVFPNIAVRLIDGTDGTTVLKTTTTDANGRYVFTELMAGDYIVEVDSPGTNYVSSTDIASSPTPNSTDSDDNGTTANGAATRSAIISLAADGGTPGDANWTETDHGEFINGALDPTSNPKAYYTMDFGFYLDLPCSITINSATPSVCDAGTNAYTLNVSVTYANAPAGDITITTDNGGSQTFTPIGTSGSETFTLTGLTSDGVVDIDVMAAYVADALCTNTAIDAYDAPASCAVCPPVRCGTIMGVKN